MSVVIADGRTTVHQFDATTGLTSPVGGEALTLFTSDPSPVEDTGCIGMAISIETGEIVATIASVDLSTATLIYIWILANGTMDLLSNGGIAGVLGDGTDTIGFHVAGSDAAVFRHNDGPVGWQCICIDSANLPALATAYRGVVGNLTMTAITEFGAGYKTLSKALGGASNCFTDIIRYGNQGLVITGGSVGTPGLFSEIAADDRLSTSLKAYGALRELVPGTFGCQAPLTFGDSVGTLSGYFADKNIVFQFENLVGGITATIYKISVVGNGTGTTHFQLGTKVGADKGTDGCSLISPSGVGAELIASDANVEDVKIFGSIISGFSQGVSFSADAVNGITHEIYSTLFTLCGQIDPAKVLFKNNSIVGSTDANGSLLLDADGTANWNTIDFTSDGTGHAIYITAAGTYTFTKFTYNGFSAVSPGSNLISNSGSTDAVVYNNSGGLVTINIAGGDSVTVRNGASATTVVNNNITVELTGIKDFTEITVYLAGTNTLVDEVEDVVANTFTFTESAGTAVDILIHNVAYFRADILNFPIPIADASIPIQQVSDPNYVNN